MKITDSTE